MSFPSCDAGQGTTPTRKVQKTVGMSEVGVLGLVDGAVAGQTRSRILTKYE